MPLEILWDEQGEFGTRLRDVLLAEADEFVRREKLTIVMASPGALLRWVTPPDSFAYWRQAKANVCDDEVIHLDKYPGGFAYSPSLWAGREGARIILLEEYH